MYVCLYVCMYICVHSDSHPKMKKGAMNPSKDFFHNDKKRKHGTCHMCMNRMCMNRMCMNRMKNILYHEKTIRTHILRCSYVCIFVCMYVYLYVCMYVYFYVCMYICVHSDSHPKMNKGAMNPSKDVTVYGGCANSASSMSMVILRESLLKSNCGRM
jgi:hypothetical protein